jgi:hypothetical protein
MASVGNEKTMVSTVECYDAWSNTYDSDGNVLQLFDDIAFEEIAQPLLNSVDRNITSQVCCELGCGTGRNTKKVLDAGWFIVSVDMKIASLKILELVYMYIIICFYTLIHHCKVSHLRLLLFEEETEENRKIITSLSQVFFEHVVEFIGTLSVMKCLSSNRTFT